MGNTNSKPSNVNPAVSKKISITDATTGKTKIVKIHPNGSMTITNSW